MLVFLYLQSVCKGRQVNANTIKHIGNTSCQDGLDLHIGQNGFAFFGLFCRVELLLHC